MSVVISCSECGNKIGDYVGPTGMNTPVESKYYTRVDGTQPGHGTSTAHECPHCHIIINELECCLMDISMSLSAPIPVAITGAPKDEDESSECQ